MRIGILLLLLISPTVFPQATGSDLVANGYALYSDAGNDLYIGALFVNEQTDDYERLLSMAEKRMEIKVITDRFSHRRFKRDLIRRAAVNNSQAVLSENAQAMEEFLSWFRSNLTRGDHIVVEKVGAQVRLSVNTIFLAMIDSPSFFNVLLNTWIGSLPPSREFKMQILGETEDEQILGTFRNVSVPSDRYAAVEGWKAEVVAIAQQAELEAQRALEAAQRAEQERLQEIARREEEERLRELALQEQLRQQAIAEAQAREEELARQRAAELAAQAQLTAENTTTVDDVNTLDSALAEPNAQGSFVEVAAANIEPVSSTRDESPREAIFLPDDEFSAENLLAVQIYTSELLVHSRKQMRYPAESLRLGHQDTIVAAVTISRSGELLEYELTERSKHSKLNSEVKRGIRRAEPYPDVPEIISGETYTFDLPVTFTIQP